MSIKKLNNARNGLATKMHDMHAKTVDEERGFTTEERESWDKMQADLDSFDSRIDTQLAAGDLKQRKLPDNSLPLQRMNLDDGDDDNQGDGGAAAAAASYADTFTQYLRYGESALSSEQRHLLYERRAQGVGVGSAGGFTVPEDFGGSIITSMKKYSGIANVCTTINSAAGNPLPWPVNTDEAANQTGALLAENTAASDQDAVFAQKILGAFKYTSGMVKVSGELAQDEDVNLDAWLEEALSIRLGRIEATHLAVGAGTTEPEGLVTGATLNQVGGAAAAITYTDLLNLEHTVDPAYRMMGQSRYVFNDMTLKAIKALADSEGRQIWLPSIADAAPATINGHPYTIDQGIADIGSGAISAVFGDISLYYMRRVAGIDVIRLTERFAEAYQIAYIGFSRMDGALMDTQAVAKLTHPV